MKEEFKCWRCGSRLVDLILPLSRREVCAHCSAEQHVCNLCNNFNPRVSGQCDEDRAEDIREKERANFCDYFSPNLTAYQADKFSGKTRAQAELDALFGKDSSPSTDESSITEKDSALTELEKLFGHSPKKD